MSVDAAIPNRFWPAVHWASMYVFSWILPLIALERFAERDAVVGGIFASLTIIDWIVAAQWEQIEKALGVKPKDELEYLRERDPTLGSAIQAMARYSAWGRWYAAQNLVNSGVPIREQDLLRIAASIVTDKMIDGHIEVRGRLPGRMEYEEIPRTDWRSSALDFVSNPVSLWKLVIIPRGGAEIAPDGTIAHASDSAAAQRTSQITEYDSLIVINLRTSGQEAMRSPTKAGDDFCASRANES